MFDGWHATGMVGVLGAAAACARLMKVPAAAIPNVMGIAASLASGVTANFATMTKPLHCGNAARNGVLAATLGKAGFTANPAVFEGPQRLFPVVLRAASMFRSKASTISAAATISSAAATASSPIRAAGSRTPSIEAALELRPRVAGRFNDIKNIHCGVARAAGQRASTAYPADTEQAKFSVGYLVPYALVHGAPRIAAFTDKALADDRSRRCSRRSRPPSIPSSAAAATTARRTSASP